MLLATTASHEIPLIDLDGTLVIQLALFLALIFLLNRFLFQPYLRLVAQRDDAIEGRVRSAEALERQAEARLVELELKLAAAKQRGAEERVRIRQEAAAYEREIVDAARQEVARHLAQAKEELRSLGTQLRAELSPEIDELSRRIASQVLGKTIH